MVEFCHFKKKSLSEVLGHRILHKNGIKKYIFYLMNPNFEVNSLVLLFVVPCNIWHKKCLSLMQYLKIDLKIMRTFLSKHKNIFQNPFLLNCVQLKTSYMDFY